MSDETRETVTPPAVRQSYLARIGLQRRSEKALFRINSLLWMAGICLLMVPLATLVDVPIARFFQSYQLPREVADALDFSILYAHGSGIFLILVGVILLAPRRRWHVPRLAALAMGSSAVATLTKTFVLRPRPTTVNLDLVSYDFAWIWSIDWTLSQVATFDAATRSFPSAYLATAAALTAGLWVVLPRGRVLFVAFCVGTMLQRLHCNSHFLSDLFGSAAVGLGWSYLCFHPRLLGTLFDKMEPERNRRRRYLKSSLAATQASADPPPIIVRPPATAATLTQEKKDSVDPRDQTESHDQRKAA